MRQTAKNIKPTGIVNEEVDLIAFSHLRWDFVFQRPHHIFSRFAKRQRVFYIEEPMFDSITPSLEMKTRQNGVIVVVPRLPSGLSVEDINSMQASLIDELFLYQGVTSYTLWYYTPMALQYTRHLKPTGIVYDCMDELSMFKDAHPSLLKFESDLLSLADVVFTGGQSLYEYKRDLHFNIHPFPSSIDLHHFEQARKKSIQDPFDQKNIAHPRIGFFGVIDERMDLKLVEQISTMKPDWQFVIIGPESKISHDDLPRRLNIHYLGAKNYSELPSYLAGWDVAMLPFAKNDATRFISPTKTPEYLAAGKPVISTSITDVVNPYETEGLVHISDTPEGWIEAIGFALKNEEHNPAWLEKVDRFLAGNSWDKTWNKMANHMDLAIELRLKMSAQERMLA